MADGKATGIDLGTTSSCVGVMQHDRVEIVADDKGNRTTPSYVAFTGTEQPIGDAVKNQVAMNPNNTVFGPTNDQGNRTTPSYVAFTDTERLIGDAAKNQVAMNPNNTVFGFELPLELQAALRQQQIIVDLLEYMTDWDWENLAKRCGKEVPYGQLVQVRRIIQERSITEPRVPTSNMSRLLDKTRGFVGKLFDGNEGCGTLIYIGKALGLCAFHSVFVKKTRTVLESTLSVDGHGLELKFVHPALDVAVYRIYDGDGVDREGPFVELDNIAAVFAGNEVHLLSFSAFDSQSQDEEEEAPMLIHGHIARVQLNRESSFSVGQYDSFPNSSGGAILSKNGRLLGMHLESLYHEDHAYYKPPSSPFAKGGPIYANKVGQPLIVPVEGQGDEEASTEESKISIDNEEDKENGNNQLLQHALVNIKSKSSLGVFLPVFYIRSELLHAGLLPGRKKNPRVKKRRQS